MFDQSSNPKSFRMKVSRIKWLTVFFAAVFLVLIGSLIYYYAHAYKVFYYDDLQTQYDQLASDNLRIKSIEKEYRRVKQENEKIRRVFGLLGQLESDSGVAAREKHDNMFSALPAMSAPADDPIESKNVTASDQERIWMPDYMVSSRVVPSLMPVNSNFIARGYKEISENQKAPHYGIDIVAEEGALVKATADGWIMFADWLTDYGNTIIMYHGYGYFSVYKHLKHILSREGLAVKLGDPIGTVGKTGLMATGTHLHFEIWKDGIAQDPGEFLPQIREALAASHMDSLTIKP